MQSEPHQRSSASPAVAAKRRCHCADERPPASAVAEAVIVLQRQAEQSWARERTAAWTDPAAGVAKAGIHNNT